jgi:hypothetical protein
LVRVDFSTRFFSSRPARRENKSHSAFTILRVHFLIKAQMLTAAHYYGENETDEVGGA